MNISQPMKKKTFLTNLLLVGALLRLDLGLGLALPVDLLLGLGFLLGLAVRLLEFGLLDVHLLQLLLRLKVKVAIVIESQ